MGESNVYGSSTSFNYSIQREKANSSRIIETSDRGRVEKQWSKLFERKKITIKLVFIPLSPRKNPNYAFMALLTEIVEFEAKKREYCAVGFFP